MASPSIPGVTNAPIPGVSAQAIPGQPSEFPGSASSVRLHDMEGRFVTGGVGVQWTGLQTLVDNTARYGDKVWAEVKQISAEILPEIVRTMQQNAPWRDVSGNARRGLHGAVINDDVNMISIIYLAHSVDYGGILETRDGGATAIIMPTIHEFTPLVLERVAQAVAHG